MKIIKETPYDKLQVIIAASDMVITSPDAARRFLHDYTRPTRVWMVGEHRIEVYNYNDDHVYIVCTCPEWGSGHRSNCEHARSLRVWLSGLTRETLRAMIVERRGPDG